MVERLGRFEVMSDREACARFDAAIKELARWAEEARPKLVAAREDLQRLHDRLAERAIRRRSAKRSAQPS